MAHDVTMTSLQRIQKKNSIKPDPSSISLSEEFPVVLCRTCPGVGGFSSSEVQKGWRESEREHTAALSTITDLCGRYHGSGRAGVSELQPLET
ncbi:hypothetical protein IRJ41_007760 [Triplophysa rosa]|uniref:Uncharacterized protein n=1 Tax=Triplophysa rosa TaxID=992332 RepID=A0A9W7W8N1_TRIRA|nr:hypothetical protein IRJ41_007760 [Triplophysa rosa]